MRLLTLLVSTLLLACGSDNKPQGALAADASTGLRFAELGPVPELPEWRDDPSTELKAELGRLLFYDRRLSQTGNTNCSNCHVSLTSFQDNLPLAVPDRSFPMDTPKTERHTPSLLNLVYAPVFRWDGSHEDLFDVLSFPLSEANMNLGRDVASAQVALKAKYANDLAGYQPYFLAAFGQDLSTLDERETWLLTGRALAHFLRRAVSRNSAFDRYNAGEDDAIDAEARAGAALFRGKARCVTCHSGPFLTDYAFHNISSERPNKRGEREDEGRAHVTGKANDAGKFLTPSLRGCYDTAPYFHDGSMPGLRSVIEHFASSAASADPLHDPVTESDIALTNDEIRQLIAFLRSLRGEQIPFQQLAPPDAFP